MSQLQSLRNRISTIRKIGKITSTMRMVSASRLRKVMDKRENVDKYWQCSKDCLDTALRDWDVNLLPEAVKGRKEEKMHLIIVIGSNRGLCGGLNTSVFRLLRKKIKELRQKDMQFMLLPVGKKSISFCRNNFQDFVKSEQGDLSISSSEEILLEVSSLFNGGNIDKVEVIYPFFSSVLSQKAKIEPVLPIYDDEQFKDLHLATTCAIKDPNPKEVLDEALSAYLKSLLMRVIANAIASETAARMVSMDNASRKCRELSDSLVLEYNRGRQDAITSELLEVISGMEALNN